MDRVLPLRALNEPVSYGPRSTIGSLKWSLRHRYFGRRLWRGLWFGEAQANRNQAAIDAQAQRKLPGSAHTVRSGRQYPVKSIGYVAF